MLLLFLYYLERITFSIFGHNLNSFAAITKLSHFAGTPCVDISFLTLMPAVLPQEIIEVIFTIIWHDLSTCSGRCEVVKLLA